MKSCSILEWLANLLKIGSVSSGTKGNQSSSRHIQVLVVEPSNLAKMLHNQNWVHLPSKGWGNNIQTIIVQMSWDLIPFPSQDATWLNSIRAPDKINISTKPKLNSGHVLQETLSFAIHPPHWHSVFFWISWYLLVTPKLFFKRPLRSLRFTPVAISKKSRFIHPLPSNIWAALRGTSLSAAKIAASRRRNAKRKRLLERWKVVVTSWGGGMSQWNVSVSEGAT